MNFFDYKSKWTLNHPNEDFFLYELHSCGEDDFVKWLRADQELICKHPEILSLQLNNVEIDENIWHELTDAFNKQQSKNLLKNVYPDGYFESINDKGGVAALLPDTYGKAKLRVSYYKENGPIYHEVYQNRYEALEVLYRQKYKPVEGALDSLVGTNAWNRGLYVCQWLSRGLHPIEGLKQNLTSKEVQLLFEDDIKLLY